MLEVTAVSFDTSYDPIAHNETLAFGDALLRLGFDDATELQIGLAALVDTMSRDRTTGRVESATGVGDSYLALRRGLSERMAVEVFVTLPTGQGASGAGDWGAGLLLPIDIPAPEGFTYSLIPEIDAVPNAGGTGRRLAIGATAGFSHALSDDVAAGFELATFHDGDPEGAALVADAIGSLAWQVSPRLQLNAEASFGRGHGRARAAAFLGFALKL